MAIRVCCAKFCVCARASHGGIVQSSECDSCVQVYILVFALVVVALLFVGFRFIFLQQN